MEFTLLGVVVVVAAPARRILPPVSETVDPLSPCLLVAVVVVLVVVHHLWPQGVLAWTVDGSLEPPAPSSQCRVPQSCTPIGLPPKPLLSPEFLSGLLGHRLPTTIFLLLLEKTIDYGSYRSGEYTTTSRADDGDVVARSAWSCQKLFVPKKITEVLHPLGSCVWAFVTKDTHAVNVFRTNNRTSFTYY